MAWLLATQTPSYVGERRRDEMARCVACHRCRTTDPGPLRCIPAIRFGYPCIIGVHLGAGEAYRVTCERARSGHTEGCYADCATHGSSSADESRPVCHA